MDAAVILYVALFLGNLAHGLILFQFPGVFISGLRALITGYNPSWEGSSYIPGCTHLCQRRTMKLLYHSIGVPVSCHGEGDGTKIEML